MLPEDLLLLFVDQRTGHTLTNAPERQATLGVRPDAVAASVPAGVACPAEGAGDPAAAVERIRRNVRDDVMNGLQARGALALQKRVFGGFVVLDPGAVEEVRPAGGSVLFGHRCRSRAAWR